MVGKLWPIFPMIGKIFRAFSSDWKKFSGSRKGHKEHKGIKGCGRNVGGEREGSYKNGRKPLRGREGAWSADCLRQLGQLGTTFSRCAAQPGGGQEHNSLHRKRIGPYGRGETGIGKACKTRAH